MSNRVIPHSKGSTAGPIRAQGACNGRDAADAVEPQLDVGVLQLIDGHLDRLNVRCTTRGQPKKRAKGKNPEGARRTGGKGGPRSCLNVACCHSKDDTARGTFWARSDRTASRAARHPPATRAARLLSTASTTERRETRGAGRTKAQNTNKKQPDAVARPATTPERSGQGHSGVTTQQGVVAVPMLFFCCSAVGARAEMHEGGGRTPGRGGHNEQAPVVDGRLW